MPRATALLGVRRYVRPRAFLSRPFAAQSRTKLKTVMTRYLGRIVEVLNERIRRITAIAKSSFERASSTAAYLVLLLLLGLAIWLSPLARLQFQSYVARFVTFYRALLDRSTALLDHAAKDPVIATILSLAEHPHFIRFLNLLAVASLAYLWIKDTKAERAHAREVAERQSIKLTAAERIHLFAHRLASVVILLLLIFPGVVIMFADSFIVLMFSLVLAAIYGAIRLVGWVIAALFE